MNEVSISQDLKRVAEFRPDPEKYKALRLLIMSGRIQPIYDKIDVDEIYDIRKG